MNSGDYDEFEDDFEEEDESLNPAPAAPALAPFVPDEAIVMEAPKLDPVVAALYGAPPPVVEEKIEAPAPAPVVMKEPEHR